MELHVLLAGVEFGPYTENQARELLGDGFLNASDPAKRLQDADWLTLSDILGKLPPAPTATSFAPPPVEEETAEEFQPPPHDEMAIAGDESSGAEQATESEASESAYASSLDATTAPEETEEPEEEPAPPPEKKTETKFATARLLTREEVEARVVKPATQSIAPPLTGQTPARPDPAEIKSTFAKALAATRSISATQAAAPTHPPSEPLPVPTPLPTPVEVEASTPPSAPPSIPSPVESGSQMRPVPSSMHSVTTTTPLMPVAPMTRAKKTMVTGSLLAKEALHRARDRSGILPPTRKVMATTTAPVPEFEPEPAPPRKRTPLVLGDQAGLAPAPPQRKAIRLTGRISLPGTSPQADKPATTEPEPMQSGLLARPTTTPSPAKAEPPPEHKTAPIALRERRDAGLAKPPARKAIRLTGPISLPGRVTQPTPPSQLEMRPPQGAVPEITEPADEVAVAPPESRKVQPPLLEPKPDTKPEPETVSPPAKARAPEPETKKEPEPAVPSPEPESRSPEGERLAELAAAASLATVAAETGTLTKPDADLTESGRLSASGHLLSTGELAERRSLKVTGSLKHTPPPRHQAVQLSSPSKPGETGALPHPGEEKASLPLPEIPPERLPSPPVAEEDLPNRPPTGKIPVSEMPTEGVKIRRRLTAKIPLPEKATEALVHESPPRRLPPPLPSKSVEILTKDAQPVDVPSDVAPSLHIEEQAIKTGAGSRKMEAAETDLTQKEVEAPAVAPAEVAAASTESAEAPADVIAKPEKVRLRRPVKLELSSRAKIQDSGRLTLEAFSKMASLELPATQPIAAPAAAAPSESPASEPMIDEPPSDAAAPAPASDYQMPRLTEAPTIAWKSARPKPAHGWEWLAYAIIATGALALCIIGYLVYPRSSGTSGQTVETPRPVLPPPEHLPTPPASASPPAVSVPTPPTNDAPPTSAAPPASVAPPANASAPSVTPPATAPAAANPAAPAAATPPAKPPVAPTAVTPSSPIQDVQRQAAAFVSDGILKYQHSDLDGAVAAFNQALDLNPKSADAFFNRGIAKAAHEDLDGAVADYSSALQVDPNMAMAYYYRGLARHSKTELDGAMADYNHAVQLDPHNALAFFNRGLIRMQKDDIDGAIVDSSRALEIDPHLIQAFYDRGLGRIAKGASDGALNDMKTFTQLAAQDHTADYARYIDYARLYMWLIETQKGQLAEANQELSAAMNSGWTGAPDSMVTRIGEYLLGQVSEADLIKSSASTIPVKDQGQRCEVWYFIGMRKLEAGDKDAALEALRKCIDTQKIDYCEYILAQEELKSLGGGGGAAQPAPPRATQVTLPDPGTMAPPAAATP